LSFLGEENLKSLGNFIGKKGIINVIVAAAAVLLLLIGGFIHARAGSGDITYSLDSNSTITYRESENKVYYTRKHYSSGGGGGIRYYTSGFVISIREASEADDLSMLDLKSDDISRQITIPPESVDNNDPEYNKNLDFYWYDGERDDDGYITTSYVIDGRVFTELLDRAASAGLSGSIYIHHVFSVRGGENDDSWHLQNKVTNDVPYYKYSELLKLSWNDTEATHNSQKACLNIKVPYKRYCYVNTAYYDETGRVFKVENDRLEGSSIWEKTIPCEVTGSDGKKYVAAEPGTVRNSSGEIMRALFIWNSDVAYRSSFPAWNLNIDRSLVNGTSIRTGNAADREGLPGGYKPKKANRYSFNIAEKNAVEVILYVPFIKKTEVPKTTPSVTPPVTPSVTPTVTPVGTASVTPKATPSVTPSGKPEEGPDITPGGPEDPELTPVVTSPAIPADPPPAVDAAVAVKYFTYDMDKGEEVWLKTELKTNSGKRNGRFSYNTGYSVELADMLFAGSEIYEPASIEGILYGDDNSLLVAGKRSFSELLNNFTGNGITGSVPGTIDAKEGSAVFTTAGTGAYYTVFVYCSPSEVKNRLVIRYVDAKNGETVDSQVYPDFFDSAVLKWHGINKELVWALPIGGFFKDIKKDGFIYKPVFLDEETVTVYTGKCGYEEKRHTYYGFGTGNIDAYYCCDCGKVTRMIYYTLNQWEAGAQTVICDGGDPKSDYHSYGVISRDAPSLRFSYVSSTAAAQSLMSFDRGYRNSSEREYTYDEENGTLWLYMSSDIDLGHTVTTVEPEKEAGIGAGVLYIPCTSEKEREPLAISVIEDNLKYVQKLDADPDWAQAVTGSGNKSPSSDFSLEIKGYDESVLVNFAFDVETEEGLRFKADTWNELCGKYYVPDDVKEGRYSIRAAAFKENGDIESEAETGIEISGKMYGLTLTDINSSAYDWKGVFKKNGIKKNGHPEAYIDGTFMDTYSDDYRYYYGTGLKNELGLTLKNDEGKTKKESFILPVLDGAGPKGNNTGMLKSGYTWSFELTVGGNVLKGKDSVIKIIPEFYHISEDGKVRTPVNIVYSGIRNGRPDNYIILNNEKTAVKVYDPKTGRDTGKRRFDFSVPDIYRCVKKDFDLDAYIDRYGGCTFEEDFFLKKGYLAVNLRIEAYDGEGNKTMTYSNIRKNVRKGMCDMWSMEGFETERRDGYGTEFGLEEGDVIVLIVPGTFYNRKTGLSDRPANISEENKIIRRNPSYMSYL